MADYLTCATDGCGRRARYIANGTPACRIDLGAVVAAECAEMTGGRITVHDLDSVNRDVSPGKALADFVAATQRAMRRG